MALKFLDHTGTGFISDAVDCVNYAVLLRRRGVDVRVMSNSWGGGGFTQVMEDAIAASADEGMLFVAAAGNARMVVDGLVLGGWLPAEREVRERWTRWVAAAWVLAAMAMALAIRAPVAMVLAGGVAQAVMLAGLAFAVLFFRYRQTDARLTPTAWWDGLVWVSCAGFILIAAWTVWEKLLPLVAD